MLSKTEAIPKKSKNIVAYLHIMLVANLEEPVVERNARRLLFVLRKRGYDITTAEIDDPGCLACLYMALSNALEVISGMATRLRE